MRYSTSFIATNKEAKEHDAINATLLQKGSFVDQTMAGVYTYLPLGLSVLNKIESIVREEMNTVGAELALPILSPQSLWETTGRLTNVDILFEARGGNDLSREHNDATYVLGFSHEEVITAIAAKHKLSYRDLPFAVYQIQTKFRNEARPKSGIMRGREFRMKDMYSFHASQEDFDEFYTQIQNVYLRIFERLGLGDDTHVVTASGGDFSSEHSHEFQVACASGEDTIFVDRATGAATNREIMADATPDQFETIQTSEVGNIFRLGTRFSDAADYRFTNEHGEQEKIIMGSYGIGTTRVMGVLVEKFHDESGIVWPASVAPFTVHLVGLNLETKTVAQRAEEVYQKLTAAGIETLFDDRTTVSPGEKFADADIIGCPWRVVVSERVGTQIEVKQRNEQKETLVDLESFLGQHA